MNIFTLNTITNSSTRFLPLGAILLLSFGAYAGDVDQTLAWSADGEIKVDITSGQIEFRGWNKDEVKLTGDFSGDNKRLTFKNSGKNIQIKLGNEGQSWWGSRSNSNVDFIVHAPYNSNLDIEGVSMRIEIEDIRGRVEANSISGAVRLNGATERIDVETVSGDIDIDDASGKFRLRSVSGDINANVDALSFDAKSVSGDIQGSIGRSEFVSLLSVSGDVDIELSLIKDGRIEGQTVSGNLELSFDDSISADFELNTGPGGNINNRLSDDKVSKNSHWGQALNFTKGDGQSSVELETMSGTIKLR